MLPFSKQLMNNVKENICVLYVNILGVADFFLPAVVVNDT